MRHQFVSILKATLLFGSLFPLAQPIWARDCLATTGAYENNPQTRSVRVVRVSDGDTVVLSDDRKVRLIGFNTMELNSANAREKQWAQKAKAIVESLVLNKPVQLTLGRDSKDRHGRWLAHLHFNDGLDLGSELIRRGLAFSVAVGKNTRCAEANTALEALTRKQGLGMWKTPLEWINTTHPLKKSQRGFQIVRTHVQRVTGKGKTRRILMANGMLGRLGSSWPLGEQATLNYLSNVLNQEVEVRGWLGGSSGTVEITLHHPANLQALEK